MDAAEGHLNPVAAKALYPNDGHWELVWELAVVHYHGPFLDQMTDDPTQGDVCLFSSAVRLES